MLRILEVARGGPTPTVGADRVLEEVPTGVVLPNGVAVSDRRREVGAIVRTEAQLEALRSFGVESTVQLDGPEGAGVVLWVFFSKRRSISADEFVDHWRGVHGPLACRHHVGMNRYVQHVVVDGSDDVVSGIAELQFASIEDLASRFYDSDEGRRAIAADVARFAGRTTDSYVAVRD